jgi:hypothetical protein
MTSRLGTGACPVACANSTANRFHLHSDITPEDFVFWRTQPRDWADERRTSHGKQVQCIHRCRAKLDQDFIVLGDGFFDLRELNNVRWSASRACNCLPKSASVGSELRSRSPQSVVSGSIGQTHRLILKKRAHPYSSSRGRESRKSWIAEAAHQVYIETPPGSHEGNPSPSVVANVIWSNPLQARGGKLCRKGQLNITKKPRNTTNMPPGTTRKPPSITRRENMKPRHIMHT